MNFKLLPKYIILVFALLLLPIDTMLAQVNIGSDAQARKGALLDFRENEDISVLNTKGLGLPRVILTGKSKLTVAPDSDNEAYAGLLVYNMTQIDDINIPKEERFCPGVHVWTGKEWDPLRPYPNHTHLVPRDLTNERGPREKLVDTRTHQNGTETLSYETAYFISRDKTSPINYNACTEANAFRYIDAGRWMTQNLRTVYMPDGTVLANKIEPSDYTSKFYYTPNDLPNREALVEKSGYLYNWAAATNSKGGADGKGNVDNPDGSNQVIEEKTADHKLRQGICPPGWHLPSNNEYQTLIGALMAEPEIYTTLEVGETNPPSHFAFLMLLKDNIHSGKAATSGRSKKSNEGGFALELPGYGQYWPGYYPWQFNWWPGIWTVLWTSSSSSTGSQSWALQFQLDGNPVGRNVTRERTYAQSVRCKED